MGSLIPFAQEVVMIHDSVLSLVGHTPLVALRRLNPYPGVTLAAKVESKSIGGSIKDRVALAMIEEAEASGQLTPGKIVIEATSGNTGIGLAMVCAVKGYRLRLLMSEWASEERKRILRAYGAEIVLTPGPLSTDGAIEEAYRLAREEPDTYVLLDQYNNPASIAAHERGTAREIWEQTDGAVTHVVATMGTTGTIMGLTKGLKAFNPAIRVVGVEPVAGHKIQGLKNMQESYPPGIYDKSKLDAVLWAEDERAFDLARRMARDEGLMVGMSSGAALDGALRIAADLTAEGRGGVVVFICPDSGERYLSTTLYSTADEAGPKVLDLASREPKVLAAGGLFTPGPSLDEAGSLEAWRRMVLLDVLRRVLAENGGTPAVAVGLADLDDRALAAAREAGLSQRDFASQTRETLAAHAAALGIAGMEFVLAGEHLDKSLGLVKKLMAKGLAYEKLRSVYFDVLRDKAYGQLTGTDLTGLSVGKTVDLAAYIKDNPLDFTLLKRVSLQDLKAGDALETEWGKVRPSWFLQQAACASAALPGLALVMAAEAHRFPNLENFRAIWQSGAAQAPRVWMAVQPASSAEAEPLTLEQALALAPSGHAVRLWLLSGSYHKVLNSSREGLGMWIKNWRRLAECRAMLERPAVDGPIAPQLTRDLESALVETSQALTRALDDDLALHHYWPALFRLAKLVNARGTTGLAATEVQALSTELDRAGRLLGIFDPAQTGQVLEPIPPQLADLLAARQQARAARDFAAADRLREEIEAAGCRVEDTPQGPRLMKS